MDLYKLNKYKLSLFLVILVINNILLTCALLDKTHLLSKLLPDVPTFADIAEKNGKSCEEYNVTTEDGYILKIFHILGDSSKPVLLMHGILDSSDIFILREENSLALTLAEQGYDVWAGNSRGNRYSRHHVELDPNTDKAFWNYTFHEMGYYDLPVIIDLILDKTGQTKLRAVGHSEGTAIYYVLGAKRPEYNKKIHVTACLAPIAYLQNAKGTLPILIKAVPVLNVALESLNYEEVIGFNSNFRSFLTFICNIPGIGYDICVKTLLFPTFGEDPEQLDEDFSHTLFKSYPAGTSRKNLIHFAQIGNSNLFAEYDYGALNWLKYSSPTPPLYDLTKVSMPIALYLGDNDYVSTIADVELLKDQLPNVVEYKVLNYSLWNHLDHVVGKYMPEYLFPQILELFSKYN